MRGAARKATGLTVFLLVGVALVPATVFAQAGPPLISNDPDTPGDGNWEINLAVAGARSDAGWELAAPDLDINYGWGERAQLSLHAPWNHQRRDDGRWQAGSGPIELAVRWRFVDEARRWETGVRVPFQPMVSRGFDPERHGEKMYSDPRFCSDPRF